MLLGVGVPLADPASVWPATTVIDVTPAVERRLGDDPQLTVRQAIARQAGIDQADIDVTVVRLPAGGALVQMHSDSTALRALAVIARRRATNAAEALHAAILALN
jgi:hypothetical protein